MSIISTIIGLPMPQSKFKKNQDVFVCDFDYENLKCSIKKGIVCDYSINTWIDPDNKLYRLTYDYSILIDLNLKKLYAEHYIFDNIEDAISLFNSQINEQIIKYKNKIENLQQQSLILDKKLIDLKNEVDNHDQTIGINSIVYYCSFDFNIIKGCLIGMSGRINSNGTLQSGFRYIIEDELFDSLNVPAEQVFSTEKKALQHAIIENDLNIEKLSNKIKLLNNILKKT